MWATLFGEVRGEPIEGQVGVANVIWTRAGKNADRLQAVCLAWAQFSCLWPSLDANGFANVKDFVQTRMGAPERLAPSERQLRLIVQGILGGDLLDNTKGATHYFASYIPTPSWAHAPAEVTARLGKHIFLKGVA